MAVATASTTAISTYCLGVGWCDELLGLGRVRRSVDR